MDGDDVDSRSSGRCPAEELHDVGGEGSAELQRISPGRDESPQKWMTTAIRCGAFAAAAPSADGGASAGGVPARSAERGARLAGRANPPAALPSACSSQPPKSSAPRVARMPRLGRSGGRVVAGEQTSSRNAASERLPSLAGTTSETFPCEGTAPPPRCGTGPASALPRPGCSLTGSLRGWARPVNGAAR